MPFSGLDRIPAGQRGCLIITSLMNTALNRR